MKKVSCIYSTSTQYKSRQIKQQQQKMWTRTMFRVSYIDVSRCQIYIRMVFWAFEVPDLRWDRRLKQEKVHENYFLSSRGAISALRSTFTNIWGSESLLRSLREKTERTPEQRSERSRCRMCVEVDARKSKVCTRTMFWVSEVANLRWGRQRNWRSSLTSTFPNTKDAPEQCSEHPRCQLCVEVDVPKNKKMHQNIVPSVRMPHLRWGRRSRTPEVANLR